MKRKRSEESAGANSDFSFRRNDKLKSIFILINNVSKNHGNQDLRFPVCLYDKIDI